MRAVVTQWMLSDAEFEHLLSPVRDELLRDRRTIEFEVDEDLFETTRVEQSIIFMLRQAAERKQT